MTSPLRHSLPLLFFLVLTLGLAGMNIGWVIPRIHALRVSIDNDRASTTLVAQQQANVLQLRQDLAGIDEKQASLEVNVWQFLEEEVFFTTFETIASQRQITIDAPVIADATPSGKILVRAMSVKLHGDPAAVFEAMNDIQKISPLVAIQKVTVARDTTVGRVVATITATTLWK